jgi:uncharacterized repeat protein (TIGR03803 family)
MRHSTITALAAAGVFSIAALFASQSQAQSFHALHRFTARNWRSDLGWTNSDGGNPSGLMLSSNTLFGTTEGGGSYAKGTIFKLKTDGTGFVTLHNFNGGDGSDPEGSLTLASNVLYGTTRLGGSSRTGTVFAVNTDGTGFRTIYSFTGGSDGKDPYAGVILVSNTLYGTTYAGGNYFNNDREGDIGEGTVFAVNTDGTGFKILHAFSGTNDGARPCCKMLLLGTTLYGTTEQGGGGQGTLFKINLDGTGFTNLHSFTKPYGAFPKWTNVDGIYLSWGLISSGSTLYGTALGGGNWNKGTVFAINTNGGDFKLLHTFNGTLDGGGPLALIELGRTLYGSAAYGGSAGKGSIFSIATNGTGFTNDVYTFSGQLNGAEPTALLLSGNTLYGIAYQGGLATGEIHSGTVFSFSLEN